MAERLRRVSEKCDEWAFALALRATADHLLEDEPPKGGVDRVSEGEASG